MKNLHWFAGNEGFADGNGVSRAVENKVVDVVVHESSADDIAWMADKTDVVVVDDAVGDGADGSEPG